MITVKNLIKEEEYASYKVETEFENSPLRISCPWSDEEGRPFKEEEVAASFNKIMHWLKENLKKIKNYCADELLDLKNNDWVENEENKVSKIEFIERMTPEAINIFEDWSMELFFDDGDLFYGHSIIVSTDTDFNIESVEIGG